MILDAHPLLNARAANSWNLDPRTRSGGVNLEGDEQIIASPAGRWQAEIRLGLLSPAQRGELAAFLSRLRGRAHGLRLRPVCSLPAAFYQRLGAVAPTPDDRVKGVPHANGVRFSLGVGYAWPLQPMRLASPAPAFARSVLLDTRGYARGLQVRDWIGLGGRLHRITGVWPREAVYRIAFEPALRLSVVAGVEVDLNPSAIMRLASDQGGFVMLDHASPQPVTLSLIEKPELT